MDCIALPSLKARNEMTWLEWNFGIFEELQPLLVGVRSFWGDLMRPSGFTPHRRLRPISSDVE